MYAHRHVIVFLKNLEKIKKIYTNYKNVFSHKQPACCLASLVHILCIVVCLLFQYPSFPKLQNLGRVISLEFQPVHHSLWSFASHQMRYKLSCKHRTFCKGESRVPYSRLYLFERSETKLKSGQKNVKIFLKQWHVKTFFVLFSKTFSKYLGPQSAPAQKWRNRFTISKEFLYFKVSHAWRHLWVATIMKVSQ